MITIGGSPLGPEERSCFACTSLLFDYRRFPRRSHGIHARLVRRIFLRRKFVPTTVPPVYPAPPVLAILKPAARVIIGVKNISTVSFTVFPDPGRIAPMQTHISDDVRWGDQP
ncbi:hypothetical protein CCP2SC5_2770003 [Azospirillaceae bacterium]